MPVKLVISNTVLVPVRGTFANEEGVAEPFAYSLRCERLTTDGMQSLLKQVNGEFAQFMRHVTRAWSDVLDDSGQPADYSDAGMARLMAQHGQAKVAYDAYADTVQAKAKN